MLLRPRQIEAAVHWNERCVPRLTTLLCNPARTQVSGYALFKYCSGHETHRLFYDICNARPEPLSGSLLKLVVALLNRFSSDSMDVSERACVLEDCRIAVFIPEHLHLRAEGLFEIRPATSVDLWLLHGVHQEVCFHEQHCFLRGLRVHRFGDAVN